MLQPPTSTGIPYLEHYNCRGGDRLPGIVTRFPAIERILCGHVHRTMQMRLAATPLCTAPSTGTAIALRSVEGVRLHHSWSRRAFCCAIGGQTTESSPIWFLSATLRLTRTYRLQNWHSFGKNITGT